ncbi:MAG: gliding motility-associated ABC transporter substrate-binding protein GldG, partial [Flavobacteriaceae bacterium]|nr:gliding motility-associated ABC transporter substrate-binding protein GldG [Flavobacteriaceae bacterium]
MILKKFILFILGIVVINLLVGLIPFRIDVTQDQRYSLSERFKNLIKSVNEPLVLEVFLQGDVPPEFQLLKSETAFMAQNIARVNPKFVKIKFNRSLDELTDEQLRAQLAKYAELGMQAARISVKERGQLTEKVVLPYALAEYKGIKMPIKLLQNNSAYESQDRVDVSLQQLEYRFADAFLKLVKVREKKIAVMRSKGELSDIELYSFLNALRPYYYIAPFSLDSAEINPNKTLRQLKNFDLLIEAKPTKTFTESEKLIIDQYFMSGGKMLWALDPVIMEQDSLYNPDGKAVAIPRDLNLKDLFFRYGFRVERGLVRDLNSAPLVMAIEEGRNTNYRPFPWTYFPIVEAINLPIYKGTEGIKLSYAGFLDTLPGKRSKTVLLQSSQRNIIEPLPALIELNEVNKGIDIAAYNNPPRIIATSLKGGFRSAYKNRIKPFEPEEFLDTISENHLIAIADGDILRNEVQRGEPTELGADRFTGFNYGNKDFLINSIHFMLNEEGLLQLMQKDFRIPFLSP